MVKFECAIHGQMWSLDNLFRYLFVPSNYERVDARPLVEYVHRLDVSPFGPADRMVRIGPGRERMTCNVPTP